MRQNAVAELCGMGEGTVCKIKKLYEKGGLKAVTIVKNGRPNGSGRSLSREQEKEIRKLLVDRTPDQLKLPYALWGRQAVGELIVQRFGIGLSVRSVGNYLKRWGYTPQKPLQRAYEQRPEAVRKWLEDDYPRIMQQAKDENADIYWGDETGLRSDDVRGRSYAPRGMTPVIRVSQKRDGFSLISTVTNKGSMRWMAFEGAMNATIMKRFLSRLISDADRKIFLILDNLRVHHSKKLTEWVEKKKENIALFYLPSYSPELNPVEIANADLKHAVTKRAPSRQKGQLKAATSNHMRSLQRNPKKVMPFFQKDTVKYAA